MSRKDNISEIQKSFGMQAAGFDSNTYHLSKAEYQDYMIEKVKPEITDQVLEVAAGTCICGRAFAPHVAKVTCFDATEEMLVVGQAEAKKTGLENMDFVKGIAEELPFADHSFDIVLSRLAFHHFVNPRDIFTEMKRVLKSGGKLVMMDMTVADVAFRDEVDRIEQMRDFSHVRDLTLAEMRDLYEKNNMKLLLQEQQDIPVSLDGWMKLTHTEASVQKKIVQLMQEDLDGKGKTGFAPYRKGDEIYFSHHWVLNIGMK